MILKANIFSMEKLNLENITKARKHLRNSKQSHPKFKSLTHIFLSATCLVTLFKNRNGLYAASERSYEPRSEKTGQVSHKPGCTATEDG